MRKLAVLLVLSLTTVVCSAAPVTIVFTSFHGAGWQEGYPYFGDVNGVSGVAIMCDDWAHGGSPGQTWQANYTNLGTGNLNSLRFNQQPNAATLYDVVGWLLLQTEQTPSTEWTDINFAVWYTFDTSTPLTSGAQVWLALAQQEANDGFPGVNFNRVAIYTPLNQYDPDPEGPQEVLTIVPEPASLVLLAGGIGALLMRKKAE
jgi:hypothetical protein